MQLTIRICSALLLAAAFNLAAAQSYPVKPVRLIFPLQPGSASNDILGRALMQRLSEALGARFPNMRFIGWEEFGSTHGDEEHKVLAELPAKLKALKVDAVVSGMGC